jgi:hypothetical protein
MKGNEGLGLDPKGRIRWSHARALPVLVVISTLISGCGTGSPPGTGAGPTKGADLVYNVCLEVNAGSVGAQMLPIVCRVIADDCKKNPGGDGCTGKLRALDEKMKPRGTSMLFTAAHAGRTDIVKTMLGTGSDPNAPVATGWTPLLIAAAEGHEGVVAALLEAGAAPNAKNQLGRTALMLASSKGFTAIVKSLLARGADPNIAPTDAQGWTALMVAARTGQVETVQVLLTGGADPAAKDKSGSTALALAEAQGHSAVARVLKEHARGR